MIGCTYGERRGDVEHDVQTGMIQLLQNEAIDLEDEVRSSYI